jgi:hypothetical protein
MADYLSKDAALSYFEFSQASYYFGLISHTHLLDRMAALRLMCAPDDPSKAFVEHILRTEEWTTEDEWVVTENRPEASRPDRPGRKESIVEPEHDDDLGPLLRFIPAGSTGLSRWEFNQYDRDYFPSIPHGHYKGRKQPKLDAYLGWIYRGSVQVGRESRSKIISLWNDDKFRDFARTAINFYLTHYPHYRGWRVPRPLVLPRPRP